MTRRTIKTKLIGASLVVAFGVVVPTAAPASGEVHDPFEGLNRRVFWFNDKLDTYLLKPIATAYDSILPSPIKIGVRNAIANLYSPVYIANNLMQGKIAGARDSAGRLVINSTLGLAGLMDTATEFGIEASREDFGQTLGVWGTGPGPYLVVPLVGPTNVRDGVGRVVDSPLRVWPLFVDFKVSAAQFGVEVVSLRAEHLDTVETIKETSFDFYAAVRNGYNQRRDAAIRDSNEATEESEEDLYYFDEDE
jgi:phospholipid-binding lipoprotein MlaA